jgi:hypothetical protein
MHFPGADASKAIIYDRPGGDAIRKFDLLPPSDLFLQ